MKISLLVLFLTLISGCVVTPIPNGRVVIQPSVEIAYIWDPITVRYYYVDNGHRYYKPYGWYDDRHPHGGPPGHRKH
jgi:hypothetical protein